MKTNKIAVIGGTGKSGKYLLNRLIENQYKLKILVRNPQDLTVDHSFVETVKGDARDYESILLLVSGCDAVISTLGQPKGEPSIFSQATKNVVRAMLKWGIDRYIVTTGLSVNTSFDQKDPKVRFATDWMYDHYPETTRDKQVEYDYLSKSKIEWTSVRLPLIVQTEEKFPIEVNLGNCPGEKISSTDLADFLIVQLSDRTYIRKSPFLSNI